MGRVLTLATNPKQYDSNDSWLQEGNGLASPSRRYFWHYLQPLLDLREKSILDIGSGTGWFLGLAKELGASVAVGVEPSIKNVEVARKNHPETETVLGTFEDFPTNRTFDIIVSIMSLVHISDLDAAMAKIAQLLNPNGMFVAVVYDFEYAKTPRFDYKLEIEHLSDQEYVVLVKRKELDIADIVRSTTRYRQAAELAGLRLVEDIPGIPTEDFLAARPQYQQFEGKATHRVLVFAR